MLLLTVLMYIDRSIQGFLCIFVYEILVKTTIPTVTIPTTTSGGLPPYSRVSYPAGKYRVTQDVYLVKL